ncbi:MAG: trypsin-like peptidase domain-containing protein [Anaerolineae bacterium]|jgi:2-alkenal reductase|nr:trypsin-like peptidase domain-containing protein [Anaerolineae bacterium]
MSMWIMNRAKRFVWLIAVLVLGYAAGWSANEGAVAQNPPRLNEIEKAISTLYVDASPSVVSISVVDPFFGEVSGGSGFVVDTAGHILTNAHVIDLEDAPDADIEVSFFDGTRVRGEIIGTDVDSDLAVVRVELSPEKLKPVTFADSDNLFIGQTALAIGSPFGQKWTLTSGIISALDRTISGLGAFQIGAVIQTDAPINPGNSGGPLLNLAGEVIGVNAQIISEDRANSGVGFAIPANLAVRVLNDLRADGQVQYAYLGVRNVDNLSLRSLERLGLPNNVQGVVVGSVTGPAQTAGLRTNDVITAIDSQPISSLGTLLAYLAINTRPGQTIVVTVLRNGQAIDLTVQLGNR